MLKAMQANSFQFVHLPSPFLGNFRHQKPALRIHNPIFSMKIDADGHKGHHIGRLVDKNLIILRKRIHEMKIMDENYAPPTKWWEWEKKYWYKNYGSDVVEILGLPQILMMNARPSVVLGMGALLVFSMVTSLFVILCCLVDIVGCIFF